MLADLDVDSLGDVGTFSTADSAVLEEGLVVNSYLMHFNPTISNQVNTTARFTFEDKIVGVIGGSAVLVASDSLSFADPNFDPTILRQSDPLDSWEILDDGYTIEFDLRAINNVDEARILTASALGEPPAVPVLLGDVNLDGVVTFADIPAFIALLQSGVFQAEADCDESGVVDFSDIPAFIEILIAS